jgi:hypothetical protein
MNAMAYHTGAYYSQTGGICVVLCQLANFDVGKDWCLRLLSRKS